MMNLLGKLRTSKPRKMRIVKYGNPCLRAKSQPVAEVDDALRQLAERMIVTMLENETEGVGLAAPQVGINLRLITIATHDPSLPVPANASPGEIVLGPRMPLALVNPEIVPTPGRCESVVEGCLSIPEVAAAVERPVQVHLRARTLDGELIDIECGGLLARCLQHEVDHLDGVLFVDRISEEDKQEAESILRAVERAEKRHLKREAKK